MGPGNFIIGGNILDKHYKNFNISRDLGEVKILDIAERGSINVHASILPRWRGAAPMEYSIYSGDNESGISYMRMNEGLDEGPILEIHKCKIEEEDDLGLSLIHI